MKRRTRAHLELIRVRIDKNLRQTIERAAEEAERPFSAEVRRALKSVYEATAETRKVDNGS